MTNPDIEGLIERLEAATVGSRELDGVLARHFGWHRVEPRHTRSKGGGWIAPEDFMGVNSDGSPRLDGLHGTEIHRDPPRLSQSLDAALALAERVLPGWVWEIRLDADGGSVQGAPVWWFEGLAAPDEGGVSADAKTAPLALCIAILNATEKDHD